jgi:hypothetical protein
LVDFTRRITMNMIMRRAMTTARSSVFVFAVLFVTTGIVQAAGHHGGASHGGGHFGGGYYTVWGYPYSYGGYYTPYGPYNNGFGVSPYQVFYYTPFDFYQQLDNDRMNFYRHSSPFGF